MAAVITRMKDTLYNLLVRRQSWIMRRYEGYVNTNTDLHTTKRLDSWLLLLKLNFQWYLGHTSNEQLFDEDADTLPPPINSSESALSLLESPLAFAQRLSGYDIVSFDVFDTLVTRPFRQPTDLFYLLAEHYSYLDFVNLRCMAEAEARKIKLGLTGSTEVILTDIYAVMERYTDIPKEEAAALEMELELKLCQANPYMLQTLELLSQHDGERKLICTSDMYLPEAFVKKLLERCGFSQFTQIFVSGECQASKHEGMLFDVVRQNLGDGTKYAHVGDNMASDINMAKKHGFEAFRCTNVNHIGNLYRTNAMSKIIGSAYGGIVNARLHCGLHSYSPAYEYGFAYGGLFVLGYCTFIHRYAQSHGMDKILFLARDGDIIKRVYDKLYPEDATCYLYWSRLVATKLGRNHYKYDYVRRFIMHKAGSGITVEQAFAEMGQQQLPERCPIEGKALLNRENGAALSEFLLDNWSTLQSAYEDEDIAAKRYLQESLTGCSHVCAVDVGWAASGANMLNYLVNEKWAMGCTVTGIVAGTNTQYSAEPHASEAMLQSGMAVSYLYSQSHNREYWRNHNPGQRHNIYFELLLSSLTPTLTGFATEGNGYRLIFGREEQENKAVIRDIQAGILDFAADYTKAFADYPYMFDISGCDAYAPFHFAVTHCSDYLEKATRGCSLNPFVGEAENRNSKLGDSLFK